MKNINSFLMLAVIAGCSFVAIGQKVGTDRLDELAVIRSRKQSALADLESQIKSIPYAAVRVYSRYQLAAWLWKDGKDELGRAEDIAIAALEDYYQNRSQVPSGFSSKTRLYSLLDTHAKDVGKRLKQKYKETSADSPDRLLDAKDGGKSAVDLAASLFARSSETFPDVTYLMMRLDEQSSPELYRLLGAIIAADRSGRTVIPTHTIELMTGFFLRPNVPPDLGRQFIGRILVRSRNVASLGLQEQMAYYRTFQRLSATIAAQYPEMVAETGTVQALLNANAHASTKEANERFERINSSFDKLAAAVSEAERTDSDADKYSLYRYAARLALERKKFVFAVDLMEKASEVELTPAPSSDKFRSEIHDQFYRDLVSAALKDAQPAGAEYAVRKTKLPIYKAESFARISAYYIDDNELDSARIAYDEAIKLLGAAESSPESISILLSMITNGSELDPIRLDEITRLTAKKINAIPSLTVEDKPETKNYRDHVMTLMKINWNLFSALTQLARDNKAAATDLGLRIEKKEFKVVATQVLSADTIDRLTKPQ